MTMTLQPSPCAWCEEAFDGAAELLDHVDLAHLAVAASRHGLLVIARRDVAAAMALAVPFVLAHPAEATVLRDLAAIVEAASSEEATAAFDAGVAELLRRAVRPRRAEPLLSPRSRR